MSFGPFLTPEEYDILSDADKETLRLLVIHPINDQHDRHFRAKFGGYRNGDLGDDPRSYQRVGYGTPPWEPPNLVPVEPTYPNPTPDDPLD